MSGPTASTIQGRLDGSELRPLSRQDLSLALSARFVLVAQAIIIGAILLASVTAKALSLVLESADFSGMLALLEKLDVNGEMNVPSWWSTLQLFAAAALLAVIGYSIRVTANTRATPWFVLAALFVGLSLEETAAVRDLFNPALRRWLGASGALHFAWVIPGVMFVALVAAGFLRFLVQLDPRTRTLFLLAGGVYVGGALGLEFLGGYLTTMHGQDHILYILTTTLEEGCEMFGIAIFIYALMTHFKRTGARFDLEVSK